MSSYLTVGCITQSDCPCPYVVLHFRLIFNKELLSAEFVCEFLFTSHNLKHQLLYKMKYKQEMNTPRKIVNFVTTFDCDKFGRIVEFHEIG